MYIPSYTTRHPPHFVIVIVIITVIIVKNLAVYNAF